MAIGTLLGIAAGARALGSVAQGAGAIAGARQQFTAEDRRRLGRGRPNNGHDNSDFDGSFP